MSPGERGADADRGADGVVPDLRADRAAALQPAGQHAGREDLAPARLVLGRGATAVIRPFTGRVQPAAPVLQAMPSVVSRSDWSQTAASSFGSSVRSSACRSGGSASRFSRLAANTARPQLSGMV